MAKRTAREFSATMEQQMKQFKPVRVNPFPLMMDAARHSQAQQTAGQPANAGAAAAGPTCLCSHCGVGLWELQVQQCHACKSCYCSSCSVVNYDEREDRVFCLDCNTDGAQLTSCEDGDPSDPFAACGGSLHSPFSQYHQQQPAHHQQHHQHGQQQHDQQHYMCSPPNRDIIGSSGACGSQAAAAAGQLSSERRSSVLRACNRAAAAAAAAADSGGSCLAAMAGISGLRKEQMSPLFAAGGLCGGFGAGGSSTGRGGGGGVLGQWDLNSSPLANMAFAAGALATPKVLPFTAG